MNQSLNECIKKKTVPANKLLQKVNYVQLSKNNRDADPVDR